MHTNPPKNSHSQNISIQKMKIIMCIRCTWNRLIISQLGLTTKIFHYVHECIPKSKKIQNTRLNFLRSSYMSTIFTSRLPFPLPFPTWFPDSQIHDRFSYSCYSPYCVDPLSPSSLASVHVFRDDHWNWIISHLSGDLFLEKTDSCSLGGHWTLHLGWGPAKYAPSILACWLVLHSAALI